MWELQNPGYTAVTASPDGFVADWQADVVAWTRWAAVLHYIDSNTPAELEPAGV